MGNIAELLQNTKEPLFSFEILPPLKGTTIQVIYDVIDPLLEFKPSFITVTYHKEEVVYKERPDGLLEKKVVQKRPGTVGISAAIRNKYNIEVMPHIICAGFTKEETENAFIDLHFLGIHNLFVVRGDPDKSERFFVPEPEGHAHALDLIKQIVNMNNGIYLDEENKNNARTNFIIGAAGYPEKHPEAPNMERDLYYLKEKVNAGASFIITQFFYDNTYYYNFVKSCREIGINVPIVPGLKPIRVKNHLNIIPKTFGVNIPEELCKEITKCKTNKEIYQVGIEWTANQVKELKKVNVPSLHFFTMSKVDNIIEIIKRVF